MHFPCCRLEWRIGRDSVPGTRPGPVTALRCSTHLHRPLADNGEAKGCTTGIPAPAVDRMHKRLCRKFAESRRQCGQSILLLIRNNEASSSDKYFTAGRIRAAAVTFGWAAGAAGGCSSLEADGCAGRAAAAGTPCGRGFWSSSGTSLVRPTLAAAPRRGLRAHSRQYTLQNALQPYFQQDKSTRRTGCSAGCWLAVGCWGQQGNLEARRGAADWIALRNTV